MDWCRARVTVAIDLKRALVAALEVGKRTEVQARRLVQEAKERLRRGGCLPFFTHSDDNFS